MWQISYGAVTEMEALIVVQWRGGAPAPSLEGAAIRGPICARARTLPSNFALRASGDDRWQSQIVDPCFWSTDLPARYILRPSGATTGCAELGIRQFGVVGDHFRCNGRRWVFRAAVPADDETNVCAWQDSRMQWVVSSYSAEQAQQASHSGVMLAADLHSVPREETLWQWSQWPAVAMVWLDAHADVDRSAIRAAAPNLIVAANVRHEETTMPSWADAWVVDAEPSLVRHVLRSAPQRPVIARDREARFTEAPAARRGCEQLQQRLAPEFSLAGYVVG